MVTIDMMPAATTKAIEIICPLRPHNSLSSFIFREDTDSPFDVVDTCACFIFDSFRYFTAAHSNDDIT